MYIPVKVKFAFTFFIALLWLLLSIYLSARWVEDLTAIIGSFLSIFIITFIAYIPGFMQMFLFIAYIIDRRPALKPCNNWPPLSILIAAYNEIDCIENTLRSILAQDYKAAIQIIVIDDGSTDGTPDLIRSLKIPNVTLVLNNHGGKASCLNTGIKHASHELIVGLDADTRMRTDALTNLVQQLLSDPPHTAAVAGSLYVANSRVSLMTRMQEWDYFHAIAAIKRIQSLFQGTLVAQGAFSLYRKSCVLEAGGWPEVVGEDIALTWSLLTLKYRIGFSDRAIAFTSVPTTYRTFFYQRSRWARGLIEAFRLHPRILITMRLTLFLVFWNVLFPIIDFVYVFAFIPGLILALFGHYYIAGPMTLAVLPITVLYTIYFYITQSRVFHRANLSVRRNWGGLVCFLLFYQILMAPACIHGYFSEFLSLKKHWGTKAS